MCQLVIIGNVGIIGFGSYGISTSAPKKYLIAKMGFSHTPTILLYPFKGALCSDVIIGSARLDKMPDPKS